LRARNKIPQLSASVRSADFQSAVPQTFSLRGEHSNWRLLLLARLPAQVGDAAPHGKTATKNLPLPLPRSLFIFRTEVEEEEENEEEEDLTRAVREDFESIALDIRRAGSFAVATTP
jgi:hypothetical protein